MHQDGDDREHAADGPAWAGRTFVGARDRRALGARPMAVSLAAGRGRAVQPVADPAIGVGPLTPGAGDDDAHDRPDVLADLEARGLVQDCTDRDALRARLAAGPDHLYYGCDPTADSLHVGNLIGLLVLRRFQDAGHRPIALAGGATGMVGDPGGRSEERNLLDEETLRANVAAIKAQIARIVDPRRPLGASSTTAPGPATCPCSTSSATSASTSR